MTVIEISVSKKDYEKLKKLDGFYSDDGFGNIETCLSDLIYFNIQPERSKREDFYQQLAKEYLDVQESWEVSPDEKISVKCFARWLDKRCGALNIAEMQ